ncbi:MAG: DUF2203 domain-containing protein [Verrucomicrobiae bacterium]|nr:DUF2203 domain-containing protein [Verrucomicrobiae bacterium]
MKKSYRFQKHFTLEEARALLPKLRQLFRRLHRHRDAARELEAALGRRVRETGADLGGAEVSELIRHSAALMEAFRQIQSLGVLIKDIDRGLVDFPHLRHGEEVFLCWELNEDDIEYWHDLDAGYAGREPL